MRRGLDLCLHRPVCAYDYPRNGHDECPQYSLDPVMGMSKVDAGIPTVASMESCHLSLHLIPSYQHKSIEQAAAKAQFVPFVC